MKLAVSAGAAAAFLLLPFMASGADLAIVCEKAGTCRHEPAEALFDIKNALPGEEYTRTVEISNERQEDCALNLSLGQVSHDDNNMAAKLRAVIADGANQYFDGEFGKLSGDEPVQLGMIKAGDINLYHWRLALDLEAGNEFQGQRIKFDIDFNVTCEEDAASETGGSVAGAKTARAIAAAAKAPRVLGQTVKNIFPGIPNTGAPGPIRPRLKVLAAILFMLLVLVILHQNRKRAKSN